MPHFRGIPVVPPVLHVNLIGIDLCRSNMCLIQNKKTKKLAHVRPYEHKKGMEICSHACLDLARSFFSFFFLSILWSRSLYYFFYFIFSIITI